MIWLSKMNTQWTSQDVGWVTWFVYTYVNLIQTLRSSALGENKRVNEINTGSQERANLLPFVFYSAFFLLHLIIIIYYFFCTYFHFASSYISIHLFSSFLVFLSPSAHFLTFSIILFHFYFSVYSLLSAFCSYSFFI